MYPTLHPIPIRPPHTLSCCRVHIFLPVPTRRTYPETPHTNRERRVFTMSHSQLGRAHPLNVMELQNCLTKKALGNRGLYPASLDASVKGFYYSTAYQSPTRGETHRTLLERCTNETRQRDGTHDRSPPRMHINVVLVRRITHEGGVCYRVHGTVFVGRMET